MQLYSVLTVLSLVNIKKYIKKRVVDLLVRKVFFFKSDSVPESPTNFFSLFLLEKNDDF